MPATAPVITTTPSPVTAFPHGGTFLTGSLDPAPPGCRQVLRSSTCGNRRGPAYRYAVSGSSGAGVPRSVGESALEICGRRHLAHRCTGSLVRTNRPRRIARSPDCVKYLRRGSAFFRPRRFSLLRRAAAVANSAMRRLSSSTSSAGFVPIGNPSVRDRAGISLPFRPLDRVEEMPPVAPGGPTASNSSGSIAGGMARYAFRYKSSIAFM